MKNWFRLYCLTEQRSIRVRRIMADPAKREADVNFLRYLEALHIANHPSHDVILKEE